MSKRVWKLGILFIFSTKNDQKFREFPCLLYPRDQKVLNFLGNCLWKMWVQLLGLTYLLQGCASYFWNSPVGLWLSWIGKLLASMGLKSCWFEARTDICNYGIQHEEMYWLHSLRHSEIQEWFAAKSFISMAKKVVKLTMEMRARQSEITSTEWWWTALIETTCEMFSLNSKILCNGVV